MNYRIDQDDVKRESFANYSYRIYENARLIATYWHDYRGDGHGIDFMGGPSEFCPVGRMTDFIEGGGSQPLSLSNRAVAYIKQKRT